MSSQIAYIFFLLILLFFSCRLEWNRSSRRYLWLRLCCTIILFGSIYLLAYPISWKRPVKISANKAIILTPGFDPDSLRDQEKQPVFTMLEGEETNLKNKITDLSLFLKGHPDINDITILGRGLPEKELPKLGHMKVRFIPGKDPGGVQHISWTRSLQYGQNFRASGKYLNRTGRDVKVGLEAFGKTVDSLSIRKDSIGTFNLQYLPSHIGLSSFQLISTSGKDTLRREPLPFQVRETKKLDIMLLSSAPGFEFRFIKDWLKETGQGVRTRTRTSLGKFNIETTEEAGTADMTGIARLDKADLLIADAGELAHLGQAERERIHAAVRRGLGLIIHGGSAKLPEPFHAPLFQKRPYPASTRDLIMHVDGTIIKNPIDQDNGLAYLLPSAAAMPLLTDRSGKIVAAKSQIGKGALVLSTLNDTYPIRLRGELEKYGKIWARLINETIRKDRSDLVVFADEDFPIGGRYSNWLLRHKGSPPNYLFDGVLLKPSQDPLLDDSWSAGIWTSGPGWKEIKGPDSAAVYLYNPDDWSELRFRRTMEANKAYFREQSFITQHPAESEAMVEQKMPAMIYYVLIILCCGFLWLEPKLF